MNTEDAQEIEDRLVAMLDLGLSLMVPADAEIRVVGIEENIEGADVEHVDLRPLKVDF